MDELIFIYNADGGIRNVLKDIIHKTLSPSTYPCALCSITYGNTGMRREWKDYIDSLDIAVKFLHKDEYYNVYGVGLPAIIFKNSSMSRVLLDKSGFLDMKTIEDLINTINKALEGIT